MQPGCKQPTHLSTVLKSHAVVDRITTTLSAMPHYSGNIILSKDRHHQPYQLSPFNASFATHQHDSVLTSTVFVLVTTGSPCSKSLQHSDYEITLHTIIAGHALALMS